MYTLIGSLTSPYVRRLRLYLHGIDYKLETVNYLDSLDDARLSQLNPIKRIPVLVVDNQAIWESRVIYSYLQKTLGKTPPSRDEDNLISAIDAWQDLLIQPFLMQRMGQAVDSSNAYFQRQASRAQLIRDYLASGVRQGLFDRWDYPAMSLYCLLDWGAFRECLRPLDLPKALLNFMEQSRSHPSITETDPRHA